MHTVFARLSTYGPPSQSRRNMCRWYCKQAINGTATLDKGAALGHGDSLAQKQSKAELLSCLSARWYTAMPRWVNCFEICSSCRHMLTVSHAQLEKLGPPEQGMGPPKRCRSRFWSPETRVSEAVRRIEWQQRPSRCWQHSTYRRREARGAAHSQMCPSSHLLLDRGTLLSTTRPA